MNKTMLVVAVGAVSGLLSVTAGCSGLGFKFAPSPQKADEHYAAGQVLASKGDTSGALAELKQAVAADPSHSTAHTAIGDIHRRQGNFQLARMSYESACNANPYLFRPHYHLGVVLQKLADDEKTADKYREMLGKAVAAYLRAITIRGDDYDSNLNLSACFFQLAQYDRAEQYCQEAIKLDGKNPVAFNNLGIIYDCQGNLYKAIAAYNQSLELDVEQPKTLLNLGSTYMRQGRLGMAIRTYKLAGRQSPKDSAPHEQIGTAHFYAASSDEAMKSFTGDVDRPETSDMGQLRDWHEKRAAEAFDAALALNAKSPAAWRGKGVLLMSQHLRDRGNLALRNQALEAWDKSLELQPNQDDLRKLVAKYRPAPTLPKL